MSNDIATIELQVDNTPVLKLVTALNSAEKAYKKFDKAYTDGKITLEQALKGIKETEVGVERLRKAVDTGASSANRLGYEMQESQKKARRFELGVQQAGYQVGDFFVQVQSGTNPLVAFGQQATQLAGFFAGPWGAGIGAGIAILTALGAALMRTDSTTKDAKKSMEDYAAALEQVKTATEDLIDKQEKLLFLNSPLAKTLSEQSQLEAKAESVKYQLEAVNSMLEKATDPSKWNEALIDKDMLESQKVSLQGQLKDLESQLDVYHAQDEALRMLNGGLSVAGGLHKAAILDKQQELRAQQELKKWVDITVTSVKSLANAEPGKGWLDGAISKAKLLAEKLWEAAKAKSAAISSEMDTGNTSWMKNRLGFTLPGSELIPQEPKIRGGGGGRSTSGGGSAVNTRLETLINSLQTEKETVDQWYEDSQASLQSASDAELAIIGGRHEAELRLEEEHQKRLAGIKETSQQSHLSSVLGAGEQILTALGQHNEKAAKMARIFGAAQALADTYAGAAAALKLPFPANLAAAASIISTGIGFVNAIKSGGTASVKGGSIGRTPTAMTSSASASPTTVMIQGMKPTDIFTGEQLSTLFDSLYKENNNRGMVFMVQR